MRFDWLNEQIKKHKFRRGAEIGVKAGRTTFELLKKNPRLHMLAVDPWICQNIRQENEKGQQKTYDGPGWDQAAHDQSEKVARARLCHFGKRVTIDKAFSVDAATRVEDGSLDFVFLDGDHSFEGCSADIDAWAPKVRIGGLITGHDIDWPGVKRAVIKKLGAHYTADDHVWWVVKIRG